MDNNSLAHTHVCKDTSEIQYVGSNGYLKGKSSLIIFERYVNLKYKYGNRHFWCRGYYLDTVGKM